MPDELINVILTGEAAVVTGFNRMAQAARNVNTELHSLGVGEGVITRFSQTVNRSGDVLRSSLSGNIVDAGQKVGTFTTTVQKGASVVDDFTRRALGITMGIIVWRGLALVTDTVSDMHTAIASLSAETVRFGLITGQSVGEATRAYLELQAVTTAQGILPSQAAPVITTAARFAPGDIGGQQQLARGAGIFANLFGVAPERAINILTAALKQQGLEASDTMGVLDQLIAVYTNSIGTVDEISNALTEATTIQTKWGTTFSETLGLVSEVSGSAGESAETTVSAMVRITDVIERLDGSKAIEFAQAFREMGINIQDASGEFLDPLQMLMNVGAMWDTLTPEMQAKAFEMLGLLKPTYQQIGRALMNSLADGQLSNLDVMAGAGERAGRAFLDSYAGQLQRARALQEEVFQTQGPGAGFVSRIATGVFEFVGQPEAAAKVNEQLRGAAPGLGGQQKEDFIKSLIGMSEEDARKAIQEWNERVAEVSGEQWRGMGLARFNPFAVSGFIQAEEALKFKTIDEGIVRWRELADAAREATGAIKPVADLGAGDVLNITGGIFRTIRPEAAPRRPVAQPRGRQLTEEQQRFRDIVLQTPEQAFEAPIEATEFTGAEIRQAFEEAKALQDQILEAERLRLIAEGLTVKQANAWVMTMREGLDVTMQVVEASSGIEIGMGIDTRALQSVLRDMREARRESEKRTKADEPGFAFRRLKDVSPEQFPQLQALAQMYNQMLTNLGSPEKSQKINLLLGEQNVFKTLNVRMSALQMALEDLTKVEKAQLAGTWNLPAGATALVPISSLDIQRWNAGQGGGNIDWASLLNATDQGSDQVTGAIGTSTREIVAAIMEGKISMAEGLKMAQDPKATALALAEAIRGRTAEVAERGVAGRGEMERILALVRAMTPGGMARTQGLEEDRQRRTRDAQALMERFGPARRGAMGGVPEGRPREMDDYYFRQRRVADTAREQPPVNVRIEPIRAAINVTIPVMLNGAVIARVLAPILATMLARAARSAAGTGTGQSGLGRVR